MHNFYRRLIRDKFIVIALFAVVVIVAIYLSGSVKVNYDMSKYLPKDAGTKKAVAVMIEEFGYPGTAELMIEDISLEEAYAAKQKILTIPGVASVSWLDDVVDIRTPIDQIPKQALAKYYLDNSSLFRIEFTEDNYSESTTEAILAIRALDSRFILAGNAENSTNVKSVLSGEIFKIMAWVLPLCLLILLLASHSWIEPFMFMVVIGISIILNMGTNIFLPNISFITHSMASILQLAICMDYSIFLMHRYYEERDKGQDVSTAVKNASVKSISSISASALTTIAGFLALMFMRYKIGADMGLVLAKGIFISYITVIFFMPAAIKVMSKFLDKTRHRFFIPSFKVIGKGVIKIRYILVVLLILSAVPLFIAQSRNEFIYGDSSISAGEGVAYDNRQLINERFGITNEISILVPKGELQKEGVLVKELYSLPHVNEVLSLLTIVPQGATLDMIPIEIKARFESDNYSRIIVGLDIEGETQEVFDSVSNVRSVLQENYPDVWYAAGVSTSLTDIKDTVDLDSKYVTLISLVAVGIVVLLIFRSLSIPLVLLFIIQASVWLNMSIPYLMGFKMAFIGYLVISALQLGATIDYGILLTNRYKENRATMDRRDSVENAIKNAGPSIVVSAMILATAGFGFGLVSQIASISELGMLIGRGASISGLISLIVLPAMLYVFDNMIVKTSLGRVKR